MNALHYFNYSSWCSFQVILVAINTKNFYYFCVGCFTFFYNILRLDVLFPFMFIVYVKIQCENGTPVHLSVQHYYVIVKIVVWNTALLINF